MSYPQPSEAQITSRTITTEQKETMARRYTPTRPSSFTSTEVAKLLISAKDGSRHA